MHAPLGELDAQTFLNEYWQRRPCLIRDAIPDFESPLDGDDLAGLACEPLAESRLIHGPLDDDQWSLEYGPFEETDFARLGDRNWTLLVQDVEKHYPPLRKLLDRFRFLPSWRLDDLMVSFAATGGSVGPHVDQYDVFLMQAEGRRHWSVSEDGPWLNRNDVPIDMLSDFAAQQEWVLEPGDMLYLPPGVAHHGVALDPCLTFSVGFRAPSAADLTMALGEWLAQQEHSGGRYTDPVLQAWPAAGEISDAQQRRFCALMTQAIEDKEALSDFLAAFLSRYRQAHQPTAGPKPPADDDIGRALGGAATLRSHPWARAAWVRQSDNVARLHVSGQAYACSPPLAQAICEPGELKIPEPLGEQDRKVLTELLMNGHILMDS